MIKLQLYTGFVVAGHGTRLIKIIDFDLLAVRSITGTTVFCKHGYTVGKNVRYYSAKINGLIHNKDNDEIHLCFDKVLA